MVIYDLNDPQFLHRWHRDTYRDQLRKKSHISAFWLSIDLSHLVDNSLPQETIR